MKDTTLCPICCSKFKNLKRDNYTLDNLHKTADYIERKCFTNLNHSVKIFADKNTNQIDYIKLSINHHYSVYAEIDFINKKTIINCLKDGEKRSIQVPKILEPDFPELNLFRDKINLFIIFS